MAEVLFHRSSGQQLGGLRSDVHLETVNRQAAAVLLIHSNVDLCLDTISVLNRTKRDGQTATSYEMFSGDVIDYESDFRCRCCELVIVKKPKDISSDLRVTGEWAMVVRRLMNHTKVIKVYLIGSRKYAYRLKF